MEGWFETLAPLKCQSLQLNGDEKKLVSLFKTQLFGQDWLTLEMLGCDPGPTVGKPYIDSLAV